MNTSKFGNIWDLIKKYDFEIKHENDELYCIICKKLMIDACQSSCGCQYCYSCITKFIENDKTKCPGEKNECKEDYLAMDRDVCRNIRLNTLISKLKVICPNELCRSELDLVDYENHLRLCNKTLGLCPYTSLGCNSNTISRDLLLSHLNNEGLLHAELLMDWIQISQNEIKELKEESKDIKIEEIIKKQESDIGILKEDLIIKQSIIDSLDREISEIKINFENFKQEMRNENEIRFCTMTDYLDARRVTAENQDKRIDDVNSNWRVERNHMETMIIDLRTALTQVEDNIKKNEVEKEADMLRLIKLNRLCNNSDYDFIWKITECDNKMKSKRNYFSEPFYSYDYKLCLQVHMKDDHVGLFVNIMKGDNDDNLQWPMKRDVTLSILDQETMEIYSKETFNYVNYTVKNGFEKPKLDKNNSFGNFKFILYSKIKFLSSVLKNDTLYISCGIS